MPCTAPLPSPPPPLPPQPAISTRTSAASCPHRWRGSGRPAQSIGAAASARMMWRAPTRVRPDGVEQAEESELVLVPSSLAPIVLPFLRAAKEIEDDNPRVAYLCRFTAFEKAHTMDPHSTGRGVRRFKTYLLHRLEKDEQEIKRRLATTDSSELRKFYEHYCNTYLDQDHGKRKPKETARYSIFSRVCVSSCFIERKMARYYQIASILYDVLKTVTPVKYHAEVRVQHAHRAGHRLKVIVEGIRAARWLKFVSHSS